ncbi:MAG: glycosyltransferase [Dysgonamonadaceae bacterium]|nr:glycosyltransferase [Dysgonamonadaceae bacterium]
MLQKKNKNLSLIVCTYNREKVLGKCLDHLTKQEDLDFELVLVNNKSTDNTDSLIRNFMNKYSHLTVKYFIENNQGLSYARNRGINEASGEYLVFLDDDAFAFPDYTRNFKNFIEKHPEFHAGGGKILPCWESGQPQWMSKYLLSIVSLLDLGDSVKLFTGRSYPIGANMIIEKKLFDRLGLFNVQLGRKGGNLEGAEEKDFFLRTKGAGIPVYYIPNLVVEHWVPDSRLTREFFTKQALAIGYSEKIRAKNISSVEYLKSCLRELFKWGATGILFVGYILSGSYKKGAKLVEFRWKISKGLLF